MPDRFAGNASRFRMMPTGDRVERIEPALPKLSPEGYWVGKELRTSDKHDQNSVMERDKL